MKNGNGITECVAGYHVVREADRMATPGRHNHEHDNYERIAIDVTQCSRHWEPSDLQPAVGPAILRLDEAHS